MCYDVSLVDVEVLSLTLDRKGFEGICIDIGAEKSVSGKQQAEAYSEANGEVLKLRESIPRRVFVFGGKKIASLGSMRVQIPVCDDRILSFMIDIVEAPIPMLLGLDVLDHHAIFANTVTNELIFAREGWSLPLTRKMGHVYLEWVNDVLYSSADLVKIHRHFYHPHPDRIYNLMRKAEDPEATPETRRSLEKITDSCEICQRLSKAPGRLRVSLPPETIVFNRVVLMDLMSLEGQTVLHMVDKDTLFSAACFLRNGETTRDIWDAYIHYWVNPYVGYSDQIHEDQGPQFQSSEWKSLLHAAGIKPTDSGVESHNALGAGETYHEYLRQIFRKVRAELPQQPVEQVLSIAVHAMNSTAGPSGLSPMLLVFGIVPRMPVKPRDLPLQRERMLALQNARSEMIKHLAKSRLSSANRMNVPRAVDNDINVGMDVLVYRERPVNKWTGPFKVTAIDEKMVWINKDGRMSLVSIDKVKEYKDPIHEPGPVPELSATGSLDAPKDSPKTVVPPSKNLDAIFDEIIAADTLICRLGNAITQTVASSEGEVDNLEQARGTIFFNAVLEKGDPRISTSAFLAAKKHEISGLMEKETFRKVHVNQLPRDANILGGRFVYKLKNVGQENEQPKARYVAQGHKDREKQFIVHNIPTLRQSSTKMLVSTASVLGFRIFSHDVKQAYLQSKDKMTRILYLRPKEEDRELFGLDYDEVLEILKPLYGVCDAGDYWGITMIAHVERDLKMTPFVGDPSFYMKSEQKRVLGLLGAYVDDCLLAGDEGFQNLTEKTLVKFDSRPRAWDNVTFLGVTIRTVQKSHLRFFELSQPEFINNLTLIPEDTTFSEFRSIRAIAAWLSHSRPDLCCAINRAAQVTEKTFCKRHIKELNTSILYAKNSAELSLIYRPLDQPSLHLRVYADASFATNDDNSSQLGYIVMLCDKSDQCHVLTFASRKSRRVVRSIMAGEVYAFSQAFDAAFMITHDLETIYCQKIPKVMLTDSKQMFDVIKKATHTTERRLMIDIAAAREAYGRGEISNLGLISSEDNIADGLTKPKVCLSLHKVLNSGKSQMKVPRWIIRTGI